ncbi:MAG: hypothetical protein LKK22_01540 [Olsenella sp.]|nr:hypothetical protein [Olsenella sp.]MCI2126634.1 hypothetical protein [Olsenella sp.]
MTISRASSITQRTSALQSIAERNAATGTGVKAGNVEVELGDEASIHAEVDQREVQGSVDDHRDIHKDIHHGRDAEDHRLVDIKDRRSDSNLGKSLELGRPAEHHHE